MLLKRADKEQLVESMVQNLEQAKTVVIVNYSGLKVKELEDLKASLREAQINFQIIKNNLFKISLAKNKITIDETITKQPLAVCWGMTDEVAPAKIAVEFTKKAPNLEIVGAIVNHQYTDINTVKQLAALPGREELLAKLVGSLNAPMSGLVNVLQGNLRNLVYILKQYQESKN